MSRKIGKIFFSLSNICVRTFDSISVWFFYFKAFPSYWSNNDGKYNGKLKRTETSWIKPTLFTHYIEQCKPALMCIHHSLLLYCGMFNRLPADLHEWFVWLFPINFRQHQIVRNFITLITKFFFSYESTMKFHIPLHRIFFSLQRETGTLATPIQLDSIIFHDLYC